jgi:hypothetical protein
MVKYTFDSNGNNGNDREYKSGRGRPKIIRIIGAVILGVVGAVLFAFLFGLVVKILWNALMPVIFGFTKITYWQAVGLVILAKLIFGSFGHHHDHDHSARFHRKIERKWHRFLGVEEEDEDEDLWKPGGSYKNWKFYDRYWKEEGKAAFEAYIERIKSEKKEE